MRGVKEIIVMMGAVIFLSFSNHCQAVEIVTDGKPQAKIVIVSDACRMVEYAAEELQTYLEKISGAKLPIEKVDPGDKVTINKDENYIFVGESPYTEKLGIKVSDLKPDGFKIIAKDNWLALVGRDYKGKPVAIVGMRREHLSVTYDKKTGLSKYGETGSLYSVYRFLENYLDVRWFMPGELGEVVPEKSSIEVKNINYQQAPDFRFRRLQYATHFNYKDYSDDMARWYRRAGFGSDKIVEMCYSITSIMKKKYKDSHPEYFVERKDGTRDYRFLCLTEPEVLKRVVEVVRDYFDTQPHGRVFPLDPEDQSLKAILVDKRLKEVNDPSMGSQGEFSDYVWNFVNKVAKEVYKTHPDKFVSCIAYVNYLVPPKTIKRLNPNVILMICKKRIYNANLERKEKTNNFIKGWKERCDKIYIWEYYNWHYDGKTLPATPVIFPHLIAEDLKTLKGISSGEFIEAETMRPSIKPMWKGRTHLNYYVTAKYYWDADQDIEELLSDYYKKFYGPAENEMRKFYTRAEEIWCSAVKDASKKKGPDLTFRFIEYSKEEISELVRYLKEAKEKAGDTVYGKRIDLMLSEASKMIKKGVFSKLPCVPLPSSAEKEEGLAAYWKFDEGEGKIVRDISGNGNDGVVHNAKWLKCKYGSSLEFNGKDSAVEIRYPKENLMPENELTVMGWFYYNEIGKGKSIGLVWTYNYSYLLRTGGGQVWFGAYAAKAGERSFRMTRFSEASLIVPGWNHIAGVYNAKTGGIRLYLNGEIMTSAGGAAPIDYKGDGKSWDWFKNFKISIGASNFGTKWQESFNGRIDEVKIYNKALSEEEVKAEYKRGEDAFLKYDKK